MTEPLADVLRRWWGDTATIREADPEALERARLVALERVDLNLAGRGALIDQLAAELRDVEVRREELRRLLRDGGSEV